MTETSADRLDAAVDEAKRFIVRAGALKKRRAEEDGIYGWQGCKESSACRRASLDLTRALAEWRTKP